MKNIFCITLFLITMAETTAQKNNLPDTGISGVYEVVQAVEDLDFAIKYFGEFGFTVIDSSEIDAITASRVYGVDSALKSYRLQNGNIDSHGLLRLLVWDTPLGQGVGYSPPETIGQRMSVMRTKDIFRIYDIFSAARSDGKHWLPTYPVSDDLFDLDDGEKSFFNKPVIVRENAVYGAFFNHVFFQRYGYHIPGYGTIGDKSPLRTSEFTHHDFIISAPDMSVLSYLSSALGLKAEDVPELDGDWSKGPKAVFKMGDGEAHWYQGFVSPNNICGKLKFFLPTSQKTDKSHLQKLGHLGITMHTFYTEKLDLVYKLVQEHNLDPTAIQSNEYKERSFVFTCPAGCTWQLIEKGTTKNKPVTELKFELTN